MGKRDNVVLQCRFLDRQEYAEREEARRAQVDAERKKHPDLPYEKLWTPEFRARNREFIPAGSMYYCWWEFDPENLEKGQAKMRKRLSRATEQQWRDRSAKSHLSMYYWRDHSFTRPPICVICPNDHPWIPDAGSSNGLGWKVTGEVPNITCTPSIGAGFTEPGKPGPKYLYHGYLTNGTFCADLDRPDAPRGIRGDGTVA